MPAVHLSSESALPAEKFAGALAGRVWRPDRHGPSVVAIRAEGVFDVSRAFPTMRDLCEAEDPAAALHAVDGEPLGPLDAILVNTPPDTRNPREPWLLAPVDLQAVKAAGVTFAVSILERVKGCKNVLAQHPDIKILSDDQNAEGSRDGGLKVFQSLLTRFDKIDAVFAINDPTAIGAQLAAKQLNRSEFIITAVDGAPDIEKEFASGTSLIKASASQDPYVMAGQSLTMAADVLAGKKPAEPTVLLDPKLITAENLKEYKGWTAVR